MASTDPEYVPADDPRVMAATVAVRTGDLDVIRALLLVEQGAANRVVVDDEEGPTARNRKSSFFANFSARYGDDSLLRIASTCLIRGSTLVTCEAA